MSTDTLYNDDWTKVGTWDIWTGDADGMPVLVTTLPLFVQSLQGTWPFLETDLQRIMAFLQLPAAQAMPKRLRREVERFIASG